MRAQSIQHCIFSTAIKKGFARAIFKKLNLKGAIMKAFRDLLKHCMDRNNPKAELDGILVDGNRLICTDTRQLLILEFKEDFCATKLDKPVMLFEKMPKEFNSVRPQDFVSILDKNDALIDNLGFKLCVPFRGDGRDISYARYPDYEHIMRPSPTAKCLEFSFDGFRNSDDILLFKSIILNNSPFDGRFLAKFAQLLLKTHLTLKVTISQETAEHPLYIEAEVKENSVLQKIVYVVMPICIDARKRQVA